MTGRKLEFVRNIILNETIKTAMTGPGASAQLIGQLFHTCFAGAELQDYFLKIAAGFFSKTQVQTMMQKYCRSFPDPDPLTVAFLSHARLQESKKRYKIDISDLLK